MWTMLCIKCKEAAIEASKSGVSYKQLSSGHSWFNSVQLYQKSIYFLIEFIHKLITRMIKYIKKDNES